MISRGMDLVEPHCGIENIDNTRLHLQCKANVHTQHQARHRAPRPWHRCASFSWKESKELTIKAKARTMPGKQDRGEPFVPKRHMMKRI